PLVVRLDELLALLNQTRAMPAHPGAAPAAVAEPAAAEPGAVEPGAVDGASVETVAATTADRPRALAPPIPLSSGRGRQFAEMLRGLAVEEARAQGRSVRLLTRGLAEIPPHYAPVVKEICIQMIRNAIAHGIERPGHRAQLGKPEEG